MNFCFGLQILLLVVLHTNVYLEEKLYSCLAARWPSHLLSYLPSVTIYLNYVHCHVQQYFSILRIIYWLNESHPIACVFAIKNIN